MSSWQFNTLWGGFNGAAEAEDARTDPPLTGFHNYACDTGIPETLPSSASGFCVGAATGAPLTGQIGNALVEGGGYWPSFVTAQGPTLSDISPRPDWVAISVGIPAYAFGAFQGDPTSAADVCRLPLVPGGPNRCGPNVVRRPQVEFIIDVECQAYTNWTTRYAEDGSYGPGSLYEQDASTIETDDAPTFPSTVGSTPDIGADIVPPNDYSHAWIPGPDEVPTLAVNANKLWVPADILTAQWTLSFPGGPWSGVSWEGFSVSIIATPYWESETETGGGLLMLVV